MEGESPEANVPIHRNAFVYRVLVGGHRELCEDLNAILIKAILGQHEYIQQHKRRKVDDEP